MANYHQVDYLRKVGEDGFAIIEKHYSRGNHQRHPPAPLPARNVTKDHHRKLAPNQYQIEPPYAYDQNHQEPYQEANYAAVKDQPALIRKQVYETWYILPMPQAPTKAGSTEISSREAAEQHGGILFIDYGYNSKPYGWGYN